MLPLCMSPSRQSAFLRDMLKLNVCLLALCSCLAREPPTVNIPEQGVLMGKEISMIRTQRIIAYLGIPYAQPPLGKLRFAPPKIDELPSWDGVRNATEYAPACLQNENDFRPQDVPFLNLISPESKLELNESCLFLNVFVPYGNAPVDGYATMVWIHPGNFTTGSPVMWNPYTLVYRQRVIVVTFAYRLNIMGFLTTMDGEAPGNYGLMDQQAALIWVKKNIKVFGGNPDNICLMGYGTGASSIGFHMANAQSHPYFHKAIVMSGNFLDPSLVKKPQDYKVLLDNLAEDFACYRKPTSEFIDCLRRAQSVELVAYSQNILWRPIYDNGLSNSTPAFIPEHPKNIFERGEFHKIPFMTGYTDMEDVLGLDLLRSEKFSEEIPDDFLSTTLRDIVMKDLPISPNNETCLYNYEHIIDSVLFFYTPAIPLMDGNAVRKLVTDFVTERGYGASAYMQASYVSKEQPTFMYRFDMKPSTLAAMPDMPEWITVPHLFDLIYVWGIPYWGQLPDQAEWDIRDKTTSDIVMSFWTNFAKNSNPTENSIYPIRWDPFNKTNPGILIIDRTFNMSGLSRMNYKSFEFWNDYYPKVLGVGTACCNATENGAEKTQSTTHISLIILISIVFIYLLC